MPVAENRQSSLIRKAGVKIPTLGKRLQTQVARQCSSATIFSHVRIIGTMIALIVAGQSRPS